MLVFSVKMKKEKWVSSNVVFAFKGIFCLCLCVFVGVLYEKCVRVRVSERVSERA